MAQFDVNIIVSDQMTQMANINREDNMIRLTKNIRTKLGVQVGDKVCIGKGNKEIKILEVNLAYIKDTNLAKNIDSNIAFVSKRVATFYSLMDNKCWIKKYDLTPLITIGADPEFILLENNVITPAYYIRKNGVFDEHSRLGVDGTCAEIRPAPSQDSCDVCNDIKSIIQEYSSYDFLDKYKWQTGTLIQDAYRKFPLGGHIHLGIPKYLLDKRKYNINNLSSFYHKLFTIVVKLLDYYIAFPLLAVELDKNNERRLTQWWGTTYGEAGKYRIQPHGLEWRTLSSMWLSNPDYSLAILNICYELMIYIFSKLVPPGDKEINEEKLIENLNNIIDVSKLDQAANIINKGLSSTNKKECNERLKEVSNICNNKHLHFLESLFMMNNTEIKNMASKDLREAWLS